MFTSYTTAPKIKSERLKRTEFAENFTDTLHRYRRDVVDCKFSYVGLTEGAANSGADALADTVTTTSSKRTTSSGFFQIDVAKVTTSAWDSY